nr:UDP-N-acetylglucosamine 2-epimerase [Streptococcus pseudopneumoniae]
MPNCSQIVNEIKIIHVESGLRSGFNDPEEFNRCLISNISDYHLCPSITAYSNLLSEGINKQKIFLVGNTMAEACILTHEKYKDDGRWKDFVLFTVHKAYNSSKINQIKEMLTTLAEIEKIIFPVHPSIKNQFNDFYHKNVEKIPPLSYIEMNKMISSVKYIVTDSAGLQEESTVLGVPCYTIGNQTARPETCINGTNTLIGYSVKKILENQKLEKNTSIPLFWDKNVNTRIEKAFRKIFYEANKEN